MSDRPKLAAKDPNDLYRNPLDCLGWAVHRLTGRGEVLPGGWVVGLGHEISMDK